MITQALLPGWAYSLQAALWQQPGSDYEEVRVSGLTHVASRRLASIWPTDPVRAAVLVLIADRPSGPSVVLTRRTSHLNRHGGDICFAGGTSEFSDSGPEDTACRETHEELGIPVSELQTLGYLPNHLLIESGFLVTPVVALTSDDTTITAQKREVNEVLAVPLATLMDRRHWKVSTRKLPGCNFPVYGIQVNQNRIVGATAGIIVTLARFIAVLGQHE